jgi:hypothetical protein
LGIGSPGSNDSFQEYFQRTPQPAFANEGRGKDNGQHGAGENNDVGQLVSPGVRGWSATIQPPMFDVVQWQTAAASDF